MQDPNADTEWNDVLRQKGILPPRELTLTEAQLQEAIEKTVAEKVTGKKAYEDMTLDELDEFEDDEDERMLESYRQSRLAELRAGQSKARFGSVTEISRPDFVVEVTNASKDAWVLVHLYRPGLPLSTLVNHHLGLLAGRHPCTKFVKIISTNCIENYPDRNLPTVFVYRDGQLAKQLVGPHLFGGTDMTTDDVEWGLSRTGAIQTTLEENPRGRGPADVLSSQLRSHVAGDEED